MRPQPTTGPFDSRGSVLLRRYFAEKTESQTDFAVRFGTTQSTVSRWAHGFLQPPIDVIAALERELGISCAAWAERLLVRRARSKAA